MQRCGALALVIGLLLGGAGAVGAQTGQAARELDRLRDEYDEVLADEVHLLVDYEKSQARKAELDMRVAELDQQVAAGQAELAAAEAQLEAAEAKARVATRQLRRAVRALARSKDRLQKRAVAAYTGTGSNGQLTGLILSAKTPQEVQLASSYAAAVLDDQRVEIERTATLKDVIANRTEQAHQAEQEAAAIEQQLSARQSQLQAALDAQVQAREAVAAELASQEQLLVEVRARKAETERRIASLQVESDSIGETLRRRQGGQPLVPSAEGVLGMPLANPTMGSPFGPRVHPIFGTVRMHNGIDMSGAMGEPIYAAGAGEVVVAGDRGGYGNAVVIDHGGQLGTLYAHQSRLGVEVGQVVEKGDVIGFVGSTGFSTGPHLHFEVRLNGVPVDPLGYL